MGDRFRVAAGKLRAFARWTWYGDGVRTPWLRRVAAAIFILFVPLPILYLLIFRFVPVPFTPQMALDFVTFQPVHHSWVSYDDISPNLAHAVIGSEDQDFCNHDGFDWKDINEAVKQHERHPHRRLRGASTISQQVARTLFLLPVRSWVRKGTEAYLTVLLEAFWPKKRILTAYLNLVDWGHGNYGAEAASEAYFHTRASALTRLEAARLATILPDPDKWHAARPGPYVASRSETVEFRAYEVTRDGLNWCVRD
ncbi:MAG: monofunctional biosynthetic peptidoglycan transglycosylase [Alphaproteobacteria bacterium]|nr:monofunctional biosynthetic peptidoglycan transglycosylase [Alphaproteobacteria bacterium]MDE1987465.1 monofunctional biosynthetic peptidoglycan transglycosylase [Alphaproteobacteria bacterium]MDE2500338.1 monofunctional biosynthetic peptidoglycan transglycosylase [Alphaproteobacteria bacterium]